MRYLLIFMILSTLLCKKSEFDRILALAQKSGEAGKYAEALDYISRAEKIESQSESLKFLKSKIYASWGQESLNQNEIENAIKYSNVSIRIFSMNDTAYNTLGVSYLALKKFDESIIYFSKDLELKPDSALAHHNLAIAYRGRGDYNKSLSYYYQALERQQKIHSKLEESLSIVELHRFLNESEKSKEALKVFESYFNSKEAEPYRSEFYERYQYSKEFLKVK